MAMMCVVTLSAMQGLRRFDMQRDEQVCVALGSSHPGGNCPRILLNEYCYITLKRGAGGATILLKSHELS